MNKQFGTRVMVSEMTAEGLGNVFVLRLLLPIAVVGKDQPVKVYEVMALTRQLDSVDVERLHAMDEHMQPVKDASDSNSESQRSSASSVGRHRRARKQTNAMIRDVVLKTAQDTPVTASEDEVTFAQQYTKTVHQYLRKDFRGALSSIGALRKMTPGHLLSPELTNGPSKRSSYAEKSLAMLERLCEEYATNCPEDFDGVYKALEK